jgi:hypothetical protein
MRRLTIHLHIALSLLSVCLCGARAETFGQWTLEQNHSNIFTLSFKQSISIHNELTTSELAFMCDKRDRSHFVGVILVPFDGTFRSDRDEVPVLIQKNPDQYHQSDLIQNWKNGSEFLFLDANDDVADLMSALKENGADTKKTVHFYFSNDVRDGPPTSNHIAISVSALRCLPFSRGSSTSSPSSAPRIDFPSFPSGELTESTERTRTTRSRARTPQR